MASRRTISAGLGSPSWSPRWPWRSPWLNNTYDELIGRPRTERRVPWLRSMLAEAEGHISSRVGITALERIVVLSVYIAVITLLIWLVFFAGSMVPSGVRG